ncbi:MAG: MmcQ/YjbR family DNA-binding protein [Planctomycetota bacterium]
MAAKKSRDPLGDLRKLSASFPETAEVVAWGHPTFRAGKKIFASYGEHEGVPTITVKATLADQAALTQDAERFFVPAYVGHQGWIGIYARRVAWPMIEELVEQSYRYVALKRMINALDESRGKR